MRGRSEYVVRWFSESDYAKSKRYEMGAYAYRFARRLVAHGREGVEVFRRDVGRWAEVNEHDWRRWE